MRIAFLTDEFHPTFGANSLVVKTVCEKLTQLGHQSYVLPFHCAAAHPAREQRENITICREVPSDDKKALKVLLKRGRFWKTGKLAYSLFRQKKDPHDFLAKKNYIAEEFLCKWLREEQIDTVVSINCSIELSFPLLRLRKKGKLPCKWFFYMLDPFASHEYYLSHAPETKLRKLQHSIMTRCDRVLATKLIYDETAQWETEDVLQKIVITEFPKVEKPSYQVCNDDIELDPAFTHVVCTGSKNEAVRNSTFTLAVCRQLQDFPVQFHFVGYGWVDDGQARKEGNCLFYPPHSPQSAKNLQLKADLLLNIGNKVTNQLPSKVLEYISTGKPIINFYKSEACPAKALLQNAVALNISEQGDLDAQVAALRAFVTASHCVTAFEEIEKAYYPYTPAAVAESFL